MKRNITETVQDITLLMVFIGLAWAIGFAIINDKKVVAKNQKELDTVQLYYNYDAIEDGCEAILDFSSVYYIDTTNMVVYYDNYDQFDMDVEYINNPQNVNEDMNMILHISKNNMVELVNRILQWISFKDSTDNEDAYKIQAMFGIKKVNNIYHIVYLGKL